MEFATSRNSMHRLPLVGGFEKEKKKERTVTKMNELVLTGKSVPFTNIISFIDLMKARTKFGSHVAPIYWIKIIILDVFLRQKDPRLPSLSGTAMEVKSFFLKH